MEGVTDNWAINSPFCYFGAVFLAVAANRLLLALLRSLKSAHEKDGSLATYLRQVGLTVYGVHPKGEDGKPSPYSDYGYPPLLGILEIAAYPVLIEIKAWAVIGAWIGFKALAQWDVWAKDRPVFNLFLIGNAFNVFVSYWLAKTFIVVT